MHRAGRPLLDSEMYVWHKTAATLAFDAKRAFQVTEEDASAVCAAYDEVWTILDQDPMHRQIL